MMSLISLLSGSRSSDFGASSDTSSPLPPCPDSPNCVRVSKIYPCSITTSRKAALASLNRLNPDSSHLDDSGLKITCVFKVLVFKDDFHLQLEETVKGTRLHLRSASRLGRHDLGVNRRRVRSFLNLFEELLKKYLHK